MPCSIVAIDNNNRKTMADPLNRQNRSRWGPSVMTSLHAWLPLMMPPKKKPGAISRPGAIPQFLFTE
jgi:hypothetical protein